MSSPSPLFSYLQFALVFPLIFILPSPFLACSFTPPLASLRSWASGSVTRRVFKRSSFGRSSKKNPTATTRTSRPCRYGLASLVTLECTEFGEALSYLIVGYTWVSSVNAALRGLINMKYYCDQFNVFPCIHK